MRRELINANSAHVLMMYHCALGILKFCGALVILPILHSACQCEARERNSFGRYVHFLGLEALMKPQLVDFGFVLTKQIRYEMLISNLNLPKK